MSKFWQKKYISKYTGKEIDDAIAKADTVPAVTAADAGSALVVDEDGKIVAGESSGGVTLVAAPQAFETALNTAIQSLAAALMGDTKLHKATFSFDTEDAGFMDVFDFYGAITDTSVRVRCGNIGVVYAEATSDGGTVKTSLKNYLIVPGLGFGEIIILMTTISDGGTVTEIDCDLYARRIEMAT